MSDVVSELMSELNNRSLLDGVDDCIIPEIKEAIGVIVQRNPWIPMDKEKPADNQMCLITNDETDYIVRGQAKYLDGDFTGWLHSMVSEITSARHITHWCDASVLPAPV